MYFNSYGNSASINLFSSQLTPELLRKLADQLDQALTLAKNNKMGNNYE